MIVWTKNFPRHKRPLGYLRLLKARHRYFVHWGLGRGLHLGLGLPHQKPGYQLFLRSLRNKYKGRRCFVIGNGPSLKDMDLSHLAGEITIGCNAIYKNFDEWGWHTNFLLFEDTEQTELRGPEIPHVHGPIKMAATYNAYAFGADEDTVFFNARRADEYYWDTLHPQFSQEFEHIVHLGSTVTYIGIQLAFHLGFDEVYLIGVDHSYGKLAEEFPPGKLKITKENYSLVQQCHFDPEYYKIGQVIGIPNVVLQDKAYEKAREVFDASGRRIFNAGKNSKLEAYERVEYDHLFRKGLKVLFISHAATVSGAPISLQILMRYFKEFTDWDMRILVRKKNGPLSPFNAIAMSRFFYQYCLPKGEAPKVRSIPYALAREVYRMGKGRYGLRGAWASLKEYRAERWPRKRQALWEEETCSELKAWKPDVIYSNTALNGDVIKRLGLEDVPVIVHVRELAMAMATLSDNQCNEFKKRPDFYFPVSNAVREYLAREFNIDNSKMKVAPVALECDWILAQSEKESVGSIRKVKLPFGNHEIIIGGLGFLNERKGPDIFVDIAQRVIEELGEDCPARFVWLGEGTLLEPLRKRVKKLGIDDKVIFTGLQRNPYPYIRVFDFVLMTSRDDPFPRVNLEAAVFGKPIICFEASGGSREFAADECGVIVPGLDIDAMVEKTLLLIKDKVLREQLGLNAQKKVRSTYDVKVIGNDIVHTVEAMYGRADNPAEEMAQV